MLKTLILLMLVTNIHAKIATNVAQDNLSLDNTFNNGNENYSLFKSNSFCKNQKTNNTASLPNRINTRVAHLKKALNISDKNDGYVVAYNNRTKNPVIVTKNIIVVGENLNATELATTHDMTVVRDFSHINTIIFDASNTDVFSIVEQLKSEKGVADARLEIIEHIRRPL